MVFRDLREHVEEVPLYEASVVVRAEIALDRSYAMNEVEAGDVIVSRLQEVLPQFNVNRITVNHKERRGGGNIWETEVAMQGNVNIDKPLARTEIQNMVRDLTTRAGFGSSDVQVRGAEKIGKVEKRGAPDDREVEAIAKRMLDRVGKKRVTRDELAKLKRGDRLTVQRAGFSEEAEIRHVDKYSDEFEVRFESDGTVGMVPFHKVEEYKQTS